MPRHFFDPAPEQQNVALVGAATLREAERLIESWVYCNPGAETFGRLYFRCSGFRTKQRFRNRSVCGSPYTRPREQLLATECSQH